MTYRYIWKIKLADEFSEDDFLTHWRESSKVLQEYDGAMGTRIHTVDGEERTYMAIAEWESKAARDAMQADSEAGESERAKRWHLFAKNQSFGEATFIGRLEELDFVPPAKRLI